MLKIILDTNIIISAAFSATSTSAQALQFAFKKHSVLASLETYNELTTVLYRKKFDTLISPEDRKLIIDTFSEDVDWVYPKEKITACRDPKDNMLLELAVAGKANFIITGDQDLLELNPFRNTQIVKPAEFLQIVEKE